MHTVEERKSIIESAKDAILRGAEIAAVHAVLKDGGIDPAVLESEGKFELSQVKGTKPIELRKEINVKVKNIAIIAIAALFIIAAGWFFRFQKLSSYHGSIALIMNRWTGSVYSVYYFGSNQGWHKVASLRTVAEPSKYVDLLPGLANKKSVDSSKRTARRKNP
jgi:hypothetical protein